MKPAYWSRWIAALVLSACGGARDEARSDSVSDSSIASVPGVGGQTDSPRLSCGVETPPALGALTPHGIGDLRVGAEVSALRARCAIVGDTTIPGPEGTRERRVTVMLAAEPVTATVDGDSVWRIEVDSPVFRTADSLGVGSLGRQLKRGRGTIATGEGNVVALREDHCGLSFLLAGATFRTRWTTLPDSARVRRVLIIGCPSIR
jgi:hypothetical protein